MLHLMLPPCCISTSISSSSSRSIFVPQPLSVLGNRPSSTNSSPPASQSLMTATASCNLRTGCIFPDSRSLAAVIDGHLSRTGFSLGNFDSSFKLLSSSTTRRKKIGISMMAKATEDGGKSGGRFYLNVTGFPFPLGPFLSRRTIRTEVQKGSIWLFEQGQALGFSSVTTNTRMTVIKLKSGGLWVHAPIGPTAECVQLLKELEAPVEFIVLPTFAYEHKIFVGPFSRAFPRAQVWVAPRQWSWPLNLPLPFLGIFGAKVLKDNGTPTPWVGEIEHKIISCPEVGIGPYVEVAFFHKRSRSLLVTDAVIFVPEKPPTVVTTEALLAAAKNGIAVKLLSAGKKVPDDPILDTAANRQKGWERMVLQILFLGPSDLLEPRKTFKQMSKKLIVSPIIKTLVYNKVPDKVQTWVKSITNDWKFKQIIPCHFAAPVAADARVFRNAFAFSDLEVDEYDNLLWSSIAGFFGRAAITYPAADMKTLSSLDAFLVSSGAVRKTILGNKKQ